MTNKALIAKINKMPAASDAEIAISQAEFNAVLFDESLQVVEKHFHNHLETNQVLFVIEGDEIAAVYVKEVTDNNTRLYKQG